MSAAMATITARSVMRLATTSSRSPIIRISVGVKTKATPSPFGISSRTPPTAGIFRTPVELSGVNLASMLSYHTATTSAQLKSMLSVAPHIQAWTLEGKRGLDMRSRERVNELPSMKLSLLNARGSLPLKGKNHKDSSTCGGLHSIGSDVTRTRGRSDAYQNHMSRIESGTRRRQHANTPTNRIEPATSRESFVPGAEDGRANEKTNHSDEMDIIGCKSTQDKSFRKSSIVKKPILQHAKRQKSQAA